MSTIFEKLAFYFQYPFVWYALIVGVLIALCSSLLGVTLVLKRFSFIGDGLSHVAFGAMAIASVLHFSNNMLFVMPVTVICAVLLLRTGQSTKIKGDAAIAMISVGALAVGYLLMNVFSTGSNISGDVCSSLFGSTSILTLTTAEVWLCVIDQKKSPTVEELKKTQAAEALEMSQPFRKPVAGNDATPQNLSQHPEKQVPEKDKNSFLNVLFIRIREILNKILNFPGNLWKRITSFSRIKNRIDWWKEFLGNERIKAAFALVYKDAKGLIRHVLPTKIDGHVTFGCEDRSPYLR